MKRLSVSWAMAAAVVFLAVHTGWCEDHGSSARTRDFFAGEDPRAPEAGLPGDLARMESPLPSREKADRYESPPTPTGQVGTVRTKDSPLRMAGPEGLTVDGWICVGTSDPEGSRLRVKSSATGHSAFLENTDPANQYSTLYVKTNGPGHAVHAESTNGSAAYFGTERGSANVGVFENKNPNNEWSTLYATTNSEGWAVHAWANHPARHAGYFDGNVKVTGRTTVQVLEITGGSDLSERFAVQGGRTAAKPGMIVSIDPECPGKLVVSTESYDPRVAGIISGAGGVEPGMLMGVRSSGGHEESHPVALCGRVKVWADAAHGGIEVGDPLTTSSTAGHAMKATDRERAFGAVIGKAMEPLPEGRGLILVLVSLQ